MASSLRTKLAIAMVVSLAGCLFFLSSDSLAQTDLESRYFPETGHTVRPLFRAFYEDHGGLAVFGYPISQSFFSPDDRAWVQYFQNARLETQGLGEKVMLSPLPMNLLIERRTAAISPQDVCAGGAYFSATGHCVILAFLDFYLYHGGPEVFGYPIAELMQDGDRLVQYFERAIFEWYPELPNGRRVQLARMGELALQADKVDDKNMTPETSDTVTRIAVSAAVETSVMGQKGGDQVIYVYVTDQFGRRVIGARVDVAVTLPRTRLTSSVALTDENGTAAFMVAVPPLNPGKTIPIQVHAEYLEHEQDTASAFRIWW